MMLKGEGVKGHDAIFSVNFELSGYSAHIAHAVCAAEEYLQGSNEQFVDHLECPTCISDTVFISRYDYQFLCHDTKGEGPRS